LDILGYLLGHNFRINYPLFYKGVFKKGAKMKRILFSVSIIPFIFISLGCVPLIIGGAAGALGAYSVSKDTIQGETDKPYGALWSSAVMVSRIRGTIKQEDSTKGVIELGDGPNQVWIRLIRLTQATTRLRISARKYHLPNVELAQDLFVKIIEEAK